MVFILLKILYYWLVDISYIINIIYKNIYEYTLIDYNKYFFEYYYNFRIYENIKYNNKFLIIKNKYS